MPRRTWQFLFLLVVLVCALVTGCDGTGEIYIAHVDKVEPTVPGLSVEATMGIRGEIIITNDMGTEVLYIYDQDGQEQFKITSMETLCKNKKGDWVHFSDGNWMVYGSSTIVYYCGSMCGQPAGRYRGQVMKEWVIEGRAGDTPFNIYGRTVYEPPW